MAGFFEHQDEYDARAREVLDEAVMNAVSAPWSPFYLVGVALFSGRILVLAVQAAVEA